MDAAVDQPQGLGLAVVERHSLKAARQFVIRQLAVVADTALAQIGEAVDHLFHHQLLGRRRLVFGKAVGSGLKGADVDELRRHP